MRTAVLLALLVAPACRMPQGIPIVSPAADAPFPAGYTVIDLTRPLDRTSPYVPHAEAFPFERVEFKGPRETGWRTGAYSGLEHMGTHLAAPLARLPGGASADTIPASALALPAVVIDVPAAAERGGLVTAADVLADEREHGAVPAGSIVVLRTGRGRLAPSDPALFGRRADGTLEYPGWSDDAVRLLARERRVRALATDCMSVDSGANVVAAPAQSAGSVAGVYFVAGLADLSSVPRRGASFVVGAVPIAGGAGAPARVIAIVPAAR